MTKDEINKLVQTGPDEWVQAVDHYRALFDQAHALLELVSAEIDFGNFKRLVDINDDEIDQFLLKTTDEA